MSTEKHAPWALLAEARVVVYEYGPLHEDIAEPNLLARIDAALAEHADSATPVVEWTQRQGSYIHDDGVNELRVYLWGDEWHWHTVVEYRADGTCATEAEAKSAAIAAARGMK